MNEKVKKSRKPRTINNAIVNVDDIKIEPGANYSNWITNIRTKLKDREMIMLQKRVDISRNIIKSSVIQFYEQNMEYFKNDKTVRVQRMNTDNFAMYNKYINPNEEIMKIMKNCENVIMNELTNWNGLKSHTIMNNKNITIREYYAKSRNWWDQKKRVILSIYFWLPIISLVEIFTKNAADQFFHHKFVDLQNNYHKYLYLLILQNMFYATIQLPNTAKRWLISASVCSIFIEKKVAFIKDLNIMEDANKWLITNDMKMRSKKMRDIVIEAVRSNYNFYKTRFQESLYNLHGEFKYYGLNGIQSGVQIEISPPISPPIVNNERKNSTEIPRASQINQHTYFCHDCHCYVALGNNNDLQQIRYSPY